MFSRTRRWSGRWPTASAPTAISSPRTGQMAFPMDVTMGEDRTTTKAGFDLTGPLARTGVEAMTTHAPRIDGSPRYQNVEQALGARPMHFSELMASLGSKDGREIAMELDRLRGKGALSRSKDGEWMLKA